MIAESAAGACDNGHPAVETYIAHLACSFVTLDLDVVIGMELRSRVGGSSAKPQAVAGTHPALRAGQDSERKWLRVSPEGSLRVGLARGAQLQNPKRAGPAH